MRRPGGHYAGPFPGCHRVGFRARPPAGGEAGAPSTEAAASRRQPHAAFPMGEEVEAVYRGLGATSPLIDKTQMARPTYICNAPGRISPMAVSPPRLANLDDAVPSLAHMIRYSAHPVSEILNLVSTLRNFHGGSNGLGRPGAIVEYQEIYPGIAPMALNSKLGERGSTSRTTTRATSPLSTYDRCLET